MTDQRSSDPTATSTLRSRYRRALHKPFNEMITIINEAVNERDIFDAMSLPSSDFEFTRDREKVDKFMEWLHQYEEDNLLQVVTRDENQYVRSAYKSGLKASERDLSSQGFEAANIDSLLDMPVHQQKLTDIYIRNFEDLNGITSEMSSQIRDELTHGLATGQNPNVIASNLTDRVEKIGKTRSKVLARTEVIESHNTAALERYKQVLGDEAEVTINAEVMSAGDRRVCDICEPLHGQVFSLQSLDDNKPPFHPQCRCTIASVPQRTATV